jgi:hypothetical protein
MRSNYTLRPPKWLLLLSAAVLPFLCSVATGTATCNGGGSSGQGGMGGNAGQGGGMGGNNSNSSDCGTFTDGIYRKFNLDLGDSGRTHRWAIFTYGSGTSGSPFTALDVSSPSSTTQHGYQIMGDVGLAGAYSNLTVSGYGSLSGDRYLHTTGRETTTGSNAVLAGSRVSSSSVDYAANAAVNALKNTSVTAAGLISTYGSPSSLNLSGGSASFSNNPFNGRYVMNLSSLTLDNGAVLNLTGSAGSAFVINVSGAFSLNNHSQIALSGGLTTSDVLINVTGNHSTFSIAGDSLLQGTLLAYNSARNGAQRTLTVDGANTLVRGEVIANKVVVTGGAKVRKPPRASCNDDREEHHREREDD